MPQSQQPEPRPEGELIRAALKASRMSARKAAKLADISDARWRQIVSGSQSVGGMKAAVVAPAGTLARMARAVGVTPDQLDDAERSDAAEELRELEAAAPPEGQEFGQAAHLDAIAALLATLPPDAQDEVLRRVALSRPARPESQSVNDESRAG